MASDKSLMLITKLIRSFAQLYHVITSINLVFKSASCILSKNPFPLVFFSRDLIPSTPRGVHPEDIPAHFPRWRP